MPPPTPLPSADAVQALRTDLAQLLEAIPGPQARAVRAAIVSAVVTLFDLALSALEPRGSSARLAPVSDTNGDPPALVEAHAQLFDTAPESPSYANTIDPPQAA